MEKTKIDKQFFINKPETKLNYVVKLTLRA